MIQLTRSIPAVNLHRFYSLQLAPTLFGEWALVMEWGRIGSPGTVRERLFDTEQSAAAALEKRTAAKNRRGYVRVSRRTAA